MKKLFIVILALAIAVLAGCGAEGSGTSPNLQTEPKQDVFIPEFMVESPEESVEPPAVSDPAQTKAPADDNARPLEPEPDIEPDIPVQSEETTPAQGSQSETPQEESPVHTEPFNDEESNNPSLFEQEPAVPSQGFEDISVQNPELPTQPEEPEFDVSYWVSFAVSYGQQAGLVYDATATDCWDTPILASAKSIYLERDITARLNRYVRYGYTAFCVWSEQLSDGRYNIYIGYA